jgi:hypothetical protein
MIKMPMALRVVGIVAIATVAAVLCVVCTDLNDRLRPYCVWFSEKVVFPALFEDPGPFPDCPDPEPSDEHEPIEVQAQRSIEWTQACTKAKLDHASALTEHAERRAMVAYTIVEVSAAFAPALVSSVLVCLLMLRLMKRRWAIDGYTRCGNCGYILKGLKEPRCPECGTAI